MAFQKLFSILVMNKDFSQPGKMAKVGDRRKHYIEKPLLGRSSANQMYLELNSWRQIFTESHNSYVYTVIDGKHLIRVYQYETNLEKKFFFFTAVPCVVIKIVKNAQFQTGDRLFFTLEGVTFTYPVDYQCHWLHPRISVYRIL